MAGFSTARDAGGGVVISLKKAINQGIIEGPRIVAAGTPIGSTGSHGDPTNGYRSDLMGDPGPRIGVANGEMNVSKQFASVSKKVRMSLR